MRPFFELPLIIIALYLLRSINGEIYCSGYGCDGDRCLPKSWVCDGSKDCDDGSDEVHCNLMCNPHEFHCLLGGCVPMSWRCDGSADCRDGSDEENCSNIICENKYSCPDSNICIDQSLVCDGFNHCPNGSDETKKACEDKVCPLGSFKCDRGYNCVPRRWICNQVEDCDDGSDELDCPTPTSATCPKSEFQCSNFDCISKEYVCDLIRDCQDGSDEVNCSQEEDSHGAVVFQGDACSKNNGGCSHFCNISRLGVRCQCFEGFQLSSKDGLACLDIDECQGPEVCSQLCENLPGSFRCLCSDGFEQDPFDHKICLKKGHSTKGKGILLTTMICLFVLIIMVFLILVLMKKWRSMNSKKIIFHRSLSSPNHSDKFTSKVDSFGSLAVASEIGKEEFTHA